MIARPRLALVALLVAAVAGACGAVGDVPAASVDGVEISRNRFQDQLELVDDHDAYRQALEQQFQATAAGEGTGTFSSGFAARLLTFDIYYAVVGAELERRDLEVTEAARTAGREQLVGQLGGEPALTALPAEWQERLVQREAELVVLRQALGDEAGSTTGSEAAREYYERNRELFDRRCLSAVLVSTAERTPLAAEQRVAELKGRIEAGEDFAAVAAEGSDDPQSAAQGGEVGCTTAAAIADPSFAAVVEDLEVGQVSEPFELSAGWVIVTVTSSDPQPFEEVRDVVEQRVEQLPQLALNDWLAARLREADVDVDPRYGTWSEDGELGLPRVEPPLGPSDPRA